MEPNQIHNSIAEQIDNMKPDHLRPGIDVGLEVIDGETLRVILPGLVAYVDVRYDAGPDTYTITRYIRGTLAGKPCVIQSEPQSDVYADQLGELCFGDDAKPWTLKWGHIEDGDGNIVKEF